MSEIYPKIVVIKRNGADGPQFPLRTKECIFGRKPECDIRIQLPNVSLEHAVVQVDNDKKIKIKNLSSSNQTLLNGKPVSQVEIQHLDVLTISDRSFRFEIPFSVQKQVRKSPKSQQHLSSTLAKTPQEKKTPNMPIPKGSPRTPPTGGSLKENICILRRHSMPLQEEEEASASQPVKIPFSPIDVNVDQSEGSADMQFGSEKESGAEHNTRRHSKRVSFGPVLSPEQFDKDLPPATPVRRGATPKRLSICGGNSIAAFGAAAKKRRSVAASPEADSIKEEVFEDQDPLKNEDPEQNSELGPSIQDEHTHKRFIEVSSGVQEELHENRQLAEKSTTPKESETSAIQESTQQISTPTGNRRSSLRLAGKNPNFPEPQSVHQTQQQTIIPNVSVEDVDETVLDSDDYTSDEGDEVWMSNGKTNMPTSIETKAIKNKMATPLRKELAKGIQLEKINKKIATPLSKEIADGIELRQTKKKMATPLRQEIADGIELRQTKNKIATPLRKEIVDGIQLRQTKKKMATPLRLEIEDGIQLRQTKKKMATPLRLEIADGIELRLTKKKIATPLRKEIAHGIQLRKTKKKMATPLRKEIADGIQLRRTKKKIATPLRKEIADGIQLRKTKKKMATPLRKEIVDGIQLRKTKKKMGTPLRKEIADGIQLRKTKKKMATPLRKEIVDGIQLRKTKKEMATPLRKEIADGIQLRKTKKKMGTPLRKEIADGIQLRKTKKKMDTPLRKEIADGIQLRKTKKKMATPLKEEIAKGIQLRETHKKLKTPIRKEIENGVSLRVTKKILSSPLQRAIQAKPKLRQTKKKLATPVRKEIESKPQLRQIMKSMNPCLQDEIKLGIKLRKTTQTLPVDLQIEIIKGKTLKSSKRSLPTPLKRAIKNGASLRKTKKSLPTPIRSQVEEGITLKETDKSKRRRIEEEIPAREPKRMKSSSSDGTDTRTRQALKTPLRKAIAMGTKLRPTRHRLATPVRRQIHSKHTLRAVRRKSAAGTSAKKAVPRKPTYAEIVKRPKKTGVKSAFAKVESSSSTITGAGVTKSETHQNNEKPAESYKSLSHVEKNTPQRKGSSWMSSLSRAANGVKTRATPLEDLQGVSQMFQTPPIAQINAEGSSENKNAGNWLSSLAKATHGPRRRGKPVEDLVGISEMFLTPPSVNREKPTMPADESTVTASPEERELHMTAALKPTKTPSLRRPAKTPVYTNPQASLEVVQPLTLRRTPSLRSAAQELVSIQVVPPIGISRTPSLRSAKKQSSVVTDECPDQQQMEFVPPIEPTKTPSMPSPDGVRAVSRKSVGNPGNRNSLGFTGLKPLMKSPKQRNAPENYEDFFVPGMFASPRRQPKHYSRNKREGLQGVARLLRTPDGKDQAAATASPKLDGIKKMMQAKDLASPNFVGLKILMKTPKSSETVDPEDYFTSELFASPEAASSPERDSSSVISMPVIGITSSESRASFVNKQVNNDFESTARVTRTKRSAPKGLNEPLSKRARRTRSSVNQEDESNVETSSNPDVTQKKPSTRKKRNSASVTPTTPEPFVFKRTQLEPIIEALSPLHSLNAPIEGNYSSSSTSMAEEEQSQTRRRARNASSHMKTETKPPLQSSRRGKQVQSKAELSFESIEVKVTNKRLAAKNTHKAEGKAVGVRKEDGEVEELKPRLTRSSRLREASSVHCMSVEKLPSAMKTRATRTRRSKSSQPENPVDETTISNTTRRSRRGTKIVEEAESVLEDTTSTQDNFEMKVSRKRRSSRAARVTSDDEEKSEIEKSVSEGIVSTSSTRSQANHETSDNSKTTIKTRSSRNMKVIVEEDEKTQLENSVLEGIKLTRRTRSQATLGMNDVARATRNTRSGPVEESTSEAQQNCLLEDTKYVRRTRSKDTLKKTGNSKTTRTTRSSHAEMITSEENGKVNQKDCVLEESKSTRRKCSKDTVGEGDSSKVKRKTRSNREEDRSNLGENSVVSVPAKRKLKGKASLAPRVTRSIKNIKAVGHKEEEAKVTFPTTQGTKRKLQEDFAPEPKRKSRSSARLQTRSGSRK